MKNDPNLKSLSWGVFFISAGIIFFELALIRLFSVVLFPSLGFFAVTVVFFGLTLGGLLVYLFPNFFSDSNFNKKLDALGLLFGLSLFIFAFIFTKIDPSSRGAVLSLIWNSVIPITIANSYLSYVFMKQASSIGRLYSYDLFGAGMGVIVCLFLLSHISPVSVIIISGALVLVSISLSSLNNKIGKIALLLFLVIAVLITVNGVPELKYTKRGLEKNSVFSKWNSFSRVSVLDERGKERFLYSLPSPDLQKVQQMGIEIDADAYTSVVEFSGNLDSVSFLKQDLSGLAYHVVRPGKALIIGPGGGRDVLMALLFGNQVTGADINPIIVKDIMKNRLRKFSGDLYLRPDVDIKVAEGRSFIKKDENKYNSINLPLVDTWASTAGGNMAIVEGYLYTVEAMEDYLWHLNEGGVLTISRWSLDGMKLVSLFLQASENLDIENPQESIAIISRIENHISLNNYMFKKGRFTADEILIIEKFAKDNGFSITYLPNRVLANADSSFILSGDWKKFAESYATNILPSTDDKPFFFFTIPTHNLLRFGFVNSYLPDGGLGLALRFAVVFTVICIFLPLIFARRRLRGTSANSVLFLLYFGLLGFSFMLIEIALIQKLILYLEYPIYSYSVVIATLLIFAGIGSSFVSKKDPSTKSFTSAVLPLIVFFALYIIFIGPLVSGTMGLNIFYKLPIAAAMNMIPAFFMGMMMPLGIKRLNSLSMSDLVPWCWAVNGSASIIASVGSVILALLYGFKAVIGIGAIGYALALLTIYFIRPSLK
jgi:hypothetical protein